MLLDPSVLQWWYIPLLVVVYQVVTYANYLYKYKKSGAKKAYYFNDKFFGFWFTKEVWFRRQTGEMVHMFPELFEKLKKDTFNLRISGDLWYATREPENMKAILSSQFNDFSLGLRNKQFRITLGDGIFTLDGAGWKHSRAMLRPQFAKEQVSHVPMLEPHVQQIIRRVKASKGATMDIQPLFFKMTIDSATEFLFGESCSSLQDDILDYSQLNGPKEMAEFPTAFNTAQEWLLLRTGFQKFYFIVTSPEFRRCNGVVHRFTDFYVKKAVAATPEELAKRTDSNYVFLYELAKQTKDPQVLRDQCLNILIAARDTTAGLMAFIFFELARNPDVFHKLRAEIAEAFGVGDNVDLSKMTFESLKKLEYLKWVINEALRLYPSVPQNARVATKDTTLPRGGGPNGTDPIFLYKGQVVAYSVLATHRNPAIYGPDAHVFRPERWADPAMKKLGWAYLPFNGGPRICLGQQFALTEASYVTARLLQAFSNIESFDGPEDPKKHTHLTMSLHAGANVRLY